MYRVEDYAFNCQDKFDRRQITAGDGFVFSTLAYAELDTYNIPFPSPLKDFSTHLGCRPILLVCAGSERFSDVVVLTQKTVFSEEPHCQFSGTAFRVENKLFVSYRGTDETVAGWLEDFEMISDPCVPSQKYAVEFLNEVAEKYDGDVYISGHSKGGNCAVYAGAFCNESVRKRVKKIYCFDGPGVLPEVRNTAEYQETLPKIEKYVPKMSFFGMFLNWTDPVIPTCCHGFWFLQHDHYAWYIDNDGNMANGKKLSWVAKKTRIVFHRIISSMSKAERKTFSKIAEDALVYANVTSMYAMSFSSILRLVKYLFTLKNRNERRFGRWLLRELVFCTLSPLK